MRALLLGSLLLAASAAEARDVRITRIEPSYRAPTVIVVQPGLFYDVRHRDEYRRCDDRHEHRPHHRGRGRGYDQRPRRCWETRGGRLVCD